MLFLKEHQKNSLNLRPYFVQGSRIPSTYLTNGNRRNITVIIKKMKEIEK